MKEFTPEQKRAYAIKQKIIREQQTKKSSEKNFIDTTIITQEEKAQEERKTKKSEFREFTAEEKKAWGIKQREIKEENERKGKAYEKYIANFFRKQGFYVWEHGLEKGRKDKSIDLMIKRENYFYFVQCKNWENWKIDHKEIKATKTDVIEFLENKPEFKKLIDGYKTKILYITSKECLNAAAKKYIEERKEEIEYQVIKIIE